MLVKLIKDVDTYTYHDYCQDRAIVHSDPYNLKGFGESRTLKIKDAQNKNGDNKSMSARSTKSCFDLHKLCKPIKNLR